MDEPPIDLDIAALFGAEPVHGERFALYVPSADCDGAPIDQRPWVEAALAIFAGIGGGATAMPQSKVPGQSGDR